MTTTSFPITGDNLTHSDWSKMFRRHHQAVDSGLGLGLSSTSDTASISSGRAMFMGFMLEVTASHALTLAAVSSTTTYVIGVRYDPADEAALGGPLSLVAGVKGAISIPSGGALWPLYEVTRQPSQTLNLAAVTSYWMNRASLYTATATQTDPDPAYMQGRAVIVRPEGLKLFDGTSWRTVKSDTGDVSSGFTAGTGWGNDACAYRILNGYCTVHLQMTRTGGTLTATSTGSLADQVMLTIPSAARPARMIVGRGSLTSGGASAGFDWRLYPSGSWSITSANPSLTIPAGTPVYATASYVI